MHLLREGDGRIVVGELAVGRRVARPQADAVVHVEDARGAAGGPHHGGGFDVVLLGVDLAVGEGAAACGAHARGRRLAGILREVVARYKVTGDALVETRPSVVRGGHDGVLEAARVLEVQVQLAGARVLLGGDAGADVGLELIEAVGDDLVVIVKNDLLDEASFEALEALSRQGCICIRVRGRDGVG